MSKKTSSLNLTQKRFQKCIEYFEKNNPLPETELKYATPYELLVSVILSAQCTDKRVNMVTPDLFRQFPVPDMLAKAKQEEVFDLIKSISYPNNKSKHLIGMAQMLVEKYNGRVPDTVEELQKLPGVGRKTANVVASVVYDVPAIPVDTHVFRVSNRIGLVKNAKTPLQVEQQLTKNVAENLQGSFHHWLILHGRYVCKARKPLCEECGLREVCLYYGKFH